MHRFAKMFWALLGCSAMALAQYQAEGAGAPPGELAPAVLATLDKNGFKITSGGAAYCEIWFRSQLPRAEKSPDRNVTLSAIPPGTMVGVIRFDGAGSDRRRPR